MTALAPTPGQTIGPFFGFALPYERGGELVPPSRPDAIRLHGTVYDGAGDPVPDALVEVWQARPDGSIPQEQGSLLRDGYTFTGWGRVPVERTGHYQFSTLVPGSTSAGTVPYFAITVFARGLTDKLCTRAYLPGDDVALAADPLLSSIEPERRGTLVAEADDRGFVFDIRLQGEGETVFLSYAQD